MGRAVGDELRRALDDPKVRYRIVEVWHLLNLRDELLERKARRERLAAIRRELARR